MQDEKIYEVYWKGPFTDDTLEKLTEEENEKFVLYKIYGSHPMYRNDILLYVGMTEIGVVNRLNQHNYWMDEERFGPSKIYFASIGHFESWKQSDEMIIFDCLDRKVIENVEELLIYAHQPVHNKKSRSSAKGAKGIRLFNTGAYGMLMPEVSALFQNC